MDLLSIPRKISRNTPHWYGILFFIILSLWLYFFLQELIGSQVSPKCGINDALQNLTLSLNALLQIHSTIAHIILTLCVLLGNLSVLFIVGRAIGTNSLRPILAIFSFFLLRQFMQMMVSLPVPPDAITYHPHFSLPFFAIYQGSNDFYFSALVGITMLATLELSLFKKNWLIYAGCLIVLFEALVMIVLRMHYTMDVFTAIITALSIWPLTKLFSPSIDKQLPRKERRLFIVLILLIGFGLLFTSQYFVQVKMPTLCVIGDRLHDWTAPINAFVHSHIKVQNSLLVFSSSLLDSLTLFLFACSLFSRGTRPALGLILFILLRQSMQLLVSLPLPEGLLWNDPGFPSLLQTYNVSNDFYFSSHTGVSLLAALEMAHFKKRWLTTLGFSIFLFEVVAVIILRAHYTMDIYTALCAAYCASILSYRWGPPIDRFLCALEKKFR